MIPVQKIIAINVFHRGGGSIQNLTCLNMRFSGRRTFVIVAIVRAVLTNLLNLLAVQLSIACFTKLVEDSLISTYNKPINN